MRRICVSSWLFSAALGLVGGVVHAQGTDALHTGGMVAGIVAQANDATAQGSMRPRSPRSIHRWHNRSGQGGNFNDPSPAGWPSNASAPGATGIGGVSGRVGAPGDGKVGAPGDGRVGAPGDGRVGAPGSGQAGAPGAGATTDSP